MKAKKRKLKKIEVLIVGLGNILAGDDGFGPYMVEFLRQNPLPYGVEVLEGGTDAFALLPYLERTERAILIDVLQTGGKPGTVYRIPLSQLAGSRSGLSQHEVSLLTLYQLPITKYQLSLPDGVLFAVEVGEIELFCEELSQTLKDAAPVVAARIREEIKKASKPVLV